MDQRRYNLDQTEEDNIKINFLCSIPRAGNTLLGSLLNQSDDIKVTANSVVTELIHRVLTLQDFPQYQDFPDYIGIHNAAKQAFFSYYKHYNCKHVLDRGSWGTEANLHYLRELKLNTKFVILYRPVFECLASMLKVMNIKELHKEEVCNSLLKRNDFIGVSMWSIENILNSKEKYKIITYDELIKSPEKTIFKVLKFLNIPKYRIKTKNFNQFSIQGIQYNDPNPELHRIRTNNIKKNSYDYLSLIPDKIIEKYEKTHIMFDNLIKSKNG